MEKVDPPLVCPQMEQQNQVRGELQTELHAEQTRHQETGELLQDSKKVCAALEEDLDSYQRQLREYADTVSCGWIGASWLR